MGHQNKPLKIEQKLVVVFDMCSSSNIIEDLTRTENLSALRSLLVRLKKYLQTESETLGFEPYKFTGDGWILLFPVTIDGKVVVKFLKELSRLFRKVFRKKIAPLLEKKLETVGLTFGIERGSLVRLMMLHRVEYVGRALNIACRLQSAIKDRDSNPSYKILLSNQVYHNYFHNLPNIKAKPVTRKLRNINGGEQYHCMKMLLPVPKS